MESKMIGKSVKDIIKSIDSIEKYNYRDKISSKLLIKLYKIKEILDKNEFQDFSEITAIIDEYRRIANEIWKDYLQSSNGHNEDFRYLIHNVGFREYYSDFINPVISTSLITNRHIAFFTNWAKGIPNGFIINPKNIVEATYYDNAFDNAIGESSEMYGTIQLPYELEYESIEEAKERDGEILYFSNNKYSECYNEINSNDFEITGYFIMTFGEGELNPEYEKAKRMAEARNIQLKEIDFIELRKKNGLLPMTEEMKRALLEHIITTRNRKILLEDPYSYRTTINKEFIDANFERFAEIYLGIKDTPNFNSQIILEQLEKLENEYEGQKSRPTEDDLKSEFQPSTIAESIRRLREELDHEFFFDEIEKRTDRG